LASWPPLSAGRTRRGRRPEGGAGDDESGATRDARRRRSGDRLAAESRRSDAKSLHHVREVHESGEASVSRVASRLSRTGRVGRMVGRVHGRVHTPTGTSVRYVRREPRRDARVDAFRSAFYRFFDFSLSYVRYLLVLPGGAGHGRGGRAGTPPRERAPSHARCAERGGAVSGGVGQCNGDDAQGCNNPFPSKRGSV
jgi:hypothetical protein